MEIRETTVDIAIVGGGLVGNTLALALAKLPLNIALIEAKSEEAQRDESFDVRSIGLSYGSHRILSAFDLWSELSEYVTPIKTVHVSDRGHFGFTRIHAEQQGLEALGYNVQINNLLSLLIEKVRAQKNITVFSPALVTQLNKENGWNVSLKTSNGEHNIHAKLLVATDGSESSIRKYLNVDADKWDYHQSAITTNLSLSRPHGNIAYERFTKTGPLALLPLREKQAALIWTVPAAKTDHYLQYTDEDFLKELKNQFGYRLGKIDSVGKRVAFPLQRVQIKKQYLPGVVFIGNAAHTLHPIAAQGFNLALRNVAALSHCIKQALKEEKSCDEESILENYVASQSRDQKRITHFTHELLKLFSNDKIPLSLCRNLGLLGMDVVPGAKTLLTQWGLGGNSKHLWTFEGINP